MLSNILKKEYIKLDVECENWEEAIRMAGDVLVKNKVVTNEYVEEAVRGVRDLGPYIVIAKGIAMPHTTSHIGVNKNGIALVRLKNPVKFGSKINDPVYYVIMLATMDIESHIEIISQISDLLDKKEFLDIMKKSKDSDAIIEYIKANE